METPVEAHNGHIEGATPHQPLIDIIGCYKAPITSFITILLPVITDQLYNSVLVSMTTDYLYNIALVAVTSEQLYNFVLVAVTTD